MAETPGSRFLLAPFITTMVFGQLFIGFFGSQQASQSVSWADPVAHVIAQPVQSAGGTIILPMSEGNAYDLDDWRCHDK